MKAGSMRGKVRSLKHRGLHIQRFYVTWLHEYPFDTNGISTYLTRDSFLENTELSLLYRPTRYAYAQTVA